MALITEQVGVQGLFTFHNNQNLILLQLESGDFKLLGREEKAELKTITGCNSPTGVFVLNCLKGEPLVLIMAQE